MWLFVPVLTVSAINFLTAMASFKPKHHRPLLNTPDVSIVVRTWDDDHIVERFIQSCLCQEYSGKIQIIIADDASEDDTPKICAKYKDRITYVRAKKHHQWKAPFLNEVIKKYAAGEILINADIDAVFPRNYVREMVRSLRDYDAVSSGCVGGNPNTMISRIRIVEDMWTYVTGMAGRETLLRSAAIYGGSHGLWMKVLKDIGYYGTKTMTEDAEVTIALNSRGYRTGFCNVTVLLEDVERLEEYLKERKRWVDGPLDMARHYRLISPYNILFSINYQFSTFTLLSAFFSFINPWFLIPFGLNFATNILSLARAKAKAHVYPWILLYILFDPMLQLATWIGVAIDKTIGKGVRWIKISGKKYHLGRKLKAVFHR